MKILIFIDWYLPGYKAGGPITSNANMVAHLKNEFEFFIITKNTDYCENIPYESVKSDSWNDIEENIHVYYFSKEQLNYKNLKQVAESFDFDIIYINGIYSYYFSILPLFLTSRKRRIVSSRGMISAHSLTVSKAKKMLFFKLAKMLNLYKNIIFHITTEEEDFFIKKILGEKCKTHLAPNLPKVIRQELYPIVKQRGTLRLTSIARIAPEKNTLYAIEMLSKCREGKIFLDLYGSVYDKQYWDVCLQKIKQLPENIKVSYKGCVAGEELQQAYIQAHFLFSPTRGENFGHSILESLSYGRPVIISDQTPWLDLEEKEIGWDISLDNPERFAEVIRMCADMNQETYNNMSKKAFDYAKALVSNPEIIAQNKALFED